MKIFKLSEEQADVAGRHARAMGLSWAAYIEQAIERWPEALAALRAVPHPADYDRWKYSGCWR